MAVGKHFQLNYQHAVDVAVPAFLGIPFCGLAVTAAFQQSYHLALLSMLATTRVPLSCWSPDCKVLRRADSVFLKSSATGPDLHHPLAQWL